MPAVARTRRLLPQDERQRASAIAELSSSLAEPSSTQLLEERVVQRVSELVGDAAALWRRDDEGHIELRATTHRDPQRREYVGRGSPGASHSDTEGVLAHVWRAGTPVRLVPEELAGWLPVMQPAYQAYAARFGMVSVLLVPLRVRGRVVAVLGVSRDEPPELDDEDERFVTQIGAVIAVALDNDRLLHQARSWLSEQNRAHLAAHRAALTDALTGLPNRRLLLERLHALAARDGQQPALLIVDLDGFKHLNDAHGHSAGDAALVEVADRLRTVVADPRLGGRTTLARLGGDEFAVLLSVSEESDLPLQVAQAICTSLAAPLLSVDGVARTGASVGVARGAEGPASTLMRHADIAMYRAKRTRTGWAEYEAGRDSAAEVRLHELTDLDRAIGNGGLHLVYQPIVPRPGAVATGTLQVEALVRWDHARRGCLCPADFLPLAQQSGRMGGLTDAVLGIALDDLVRWRDEGRQVQVSVNVGAEVLADRSFLPRLEGRLDERALAPGALCLELTESEVLSPEGRTLLERVRATGMTVSLDDFGTGYSSLSYLADLPLDRLKLDRSFVRRLSADARMASFVGGLIGLVHALGLPIVAEGVEQSDEADLLDELGVSFQQGFLHSRPVRAAALPEFWSRPVRA
jgi:diguanylate cyclase (GGDEF)-like protein